jgi:hypothetical protein
MSKEWILNNSMNRWQLNFKRNVGPTSESIRKCAPDSKEEWEEYYFSNVKSKEHIISLGKKLFEHIKKEVKAEVDAVSEKDCIDYINQLVIDRTYDGYKREIELIKGELQDLLSYKIEESSDEWDRLYGVDFYIKINNYYVGIQIKPQDIGFTSQIWAKEYNNIQKQHNKFTEKYKGKVFWVHSVKQGEKKVIQNKEVIDEIKKEIKRIEELK